MRKSKKEERNLEKVLALLGQVGVTVDKKEIQTTVVAHRQSEGEKLEAVLASVRRPGDFTYRNCKRQACGQPFGSNYRSVGYCSDLCRIIEFEQLTGCKWTSKPAEERWGGEPPLIIPPEIVYRMFEYSKTLLGYAETQGWESPSDVPQPSFSQPASVVESNVVEEDPTLLNGKSQSTLFLQPARKVRLSLNIESGAENK